MGETCIHTSWFHQQEKVWQSNARACGNIGQEECGGVEARGRWWSRGESRRFPGRTETQRDVRVSHFEKDAELFPKFSGIDPLCELRGSAHGSALRGRAPRGTLRMESLDGDVGAIPISLEDAPKIAPSQFGAELRVARWLVFASTMPTPIQRDPGTSPVLTRP